MITIKVEGDRTLSARVSAMPGAVRSALKAKIRDLTLALQRKVKTEKLSGPTGPHTLSVGTNTSGHTGGQLRASVFQRLEDAGSGIVGSVGYSADVPYAAIHEFGGVINVPEIVPVKAKALRFSIGGKTVFAARVAAHSITMPERAPLRTAFAEMTGEIRDGLKKAVEEGIRNAR